MLWIFLYSVWKNLWSLIQTKDASIQNHENLWNDVDKAEEDSNQNENHCDIIIYFLYYWKGMKVAYLFLYKFSVMYQRDTLKLIMMTQVVTEKMI